MQINDEEVIYDRGSLTYVWDVSNNERTLFNSFTDFFLYFLLSKNIENRPERKKATLLAFTRAATGADISPPRSFS